MATEKVYALLRTDYLDKTDSEGRNNVISIHATPDSAKSALDKHVAAQNKSLKLKSPNTNKSTYPDGLYGTLVIVGDEDYHSYDARVVEFPLEGVPAMNGAAGKAGKKTAASRKAAAAADEDEDDDEDAAHLPTGRPDALSGLSFLITGTLDGLDRKGGEALIVRHGGTMVNGLKDRPDYVVCGVKPGPKKMVEIQEEELETLSQKELYRFIRTRDPGTGAGRGRKRAAPAKEEEVEVEEKGGRGRKKGKK